MSPRTPLCRRPFPLETGKDRRLIVATYSYIGGLSSAARAIAIADLHVSLGGQSRFLDVDDGQTDVLEQAIQRIDFVLLRLRHRRAHERARDQPAQPGRRLVTDVK